MYSCCVFERCEWLWCCSCTLCSCSRASSSCPVKVRYSPIPILNVLSFCTLWFARWRLVEVVAKYDWTFWCPAIISYKTVNGDKTYQKAVHMTLQGVALLLGVVGILFAYKFHHDNNIQNFYSLHSWFGIITIIFYLIQVWFTLPHVVLAIHTLHSYWM